ncbi:MAG: LPS assembly lipoprotein LptE [Steroidobacteraceae bacterium]
MSKRALLLLPLLALLASCGFRLQGAMPLPVSLHASYIDAKDDQSEFVGALRSALRSSGVALSQSRSAEVAQITVLKETISERVLSVSARNTPTDYELVYRVELSVSAQGRELMAPEELSLSRVYSFDERKLLAKEREKEILSDALAHELASVAIRRLASL